MQEENGGDVMMNEAEDQLVLMHETENLSRSNIFALQVCSYPLCSHI